MRTLPTCAMKAINSWPSSPPSQRRRRSILHNSSLHVQKLLSTFGIKTGSREFPFRSWEGLPDHALLAIKWHLEKGRSYWHWVVFVRETGQSYVLDSKKSLRSNRRTDFGRMKPKWYIPVKGAQQRLPTDALRAIARPGIGPGRRNSNNSCRS
jgi:hypothetical protein